MFAFFNQICINSVTSEDDHRRITRRSLDYFFLGRRPRHFQPLWLVYAILSRVYRQSELSTCQSVSTSICLGPRRLASWEKTMRVHSNTKQTVHRTVSCECVRAAASVHCPVTSVQCPVGFTPEIVWMYVVKTILMLKIMAVTIELFTAPALYRVSYQVLKCSIDSGSS